MALIGNLDDPCGFESCPVGTIGEHTMRQMDAHAGERTIDLDYEDDPLAHTQQMLMSAGLPDGCLIADTVVAKAMVMDANAGPARVKVPLLVLELSLGVPGGPPRHVGDVALLAPPDVMRHLGKLLRDTCNGAANAGER